MYQTNSIRSVRQSRYLSLLFLSTIFSFASPLAAQYEIERPIVNTASTPVNGVTNVAYPSFDGRYIAFQSNATNIVAGMSGLPYTHVYIKDNQTGEHKMVSRNADGQHGNQSSSVADISPDGRFVLFNSQASNLIPEDINGVNDVFLADMQLNTLTRVSVRSDGTEADSGSVGRSVSNDGYFVTFYSAATNLIDGDTNALQDVFMHDLQSSTTTRVSIGTGIDGVELDALADGGSMSGDGRFVVFNSEATNLFVDDTAFSDVFLRDTQLNTTIRVNYRSDGTGPSNGESLGSSLSNDGLYVFFTSNSSTIDPGAIPNTRHSIFKYTISTGNASQVSRAGPNNDVYGPTDVSSDGRYIVYSSAASNLAPGDTNSLNDVFLTDTESGMTSRANLNNSGEQTVIDGSYGHSNALAISGDGRLTYFASTANNLLEEDVKNQVDVFVRDTQAAETSLVIGSATPGLELGKATRLAFSTEDGRYLTFTGTDLGLIAGADNTYAQIYLLDRQTGEYTLVTRARESDFGVASRTQKASSSVAVVTPDGRYVVFGSYAFNMVDVDSTNSLDIFLYDTQTETMKIISVGGYVFGPMRPSALSADGVFVTFAAHNSTLVPGDNNFLHDIYRYNIQTGEAIQISVDSNGTVGGGNGSSIYPSISQDGNFVVFQSSSSNLVDGDTNSQTDIFVRDIEAGETFRVSKNSAGDESNDSSRLGVISGDGRYTAFMSNASNLVDSDGPGEDMFVHDRQTGTTTQANVDSDGNAVSGANAHGPSISHDGQFIVFDSLATDLVPDDTNGRRDIFVHNRVSGFTRLVSHSAAGDLGDGDSGTSSPPVITEGGEYIIFDSTASNLVLDDTNSTTDIFRATNPLGAAYDLIFGGAGGSMEDQP